MSNEVVTARQLERVEAMRHLPGTYSLALRLRDAGLTNELIAECLAVEREALDLLLQVAEAKLAAILRGEQAG
jgi:orotate phosphoribosyltransferase-like protein